MVMKNGYWHKVISEWFKDSEKYKSQVKYSGCVQGQPFSSMLHKVYVGDSFKIFVTVLTCWCHQHLKIDVIIKSPK